MTKINLQKDDSIQKEFSEEVRDIVDRMPTYWTMWTALVTFVFISIIIILGFIIKYPDTVFGEITITTDSAPVRLSAQTSGRLHLIRKNREVLNQGDYIAYIESGVTFSDFLWIDHFLDTVNIHKSFILPDF